MFQRLKLWECLSGGQVDNVKMLERELDNAMALHNLNERHRQKLMDGIPDVAPHPPGAHIITKDLDVKQMYPKPISMEDAKFPAHAKQFREELKSIAPSLDKVLRVGSREQLFSSRTKKRGENLFLGGIVLQVALQQEPNDQWIARFNVGASMKNPVYKCWVKLQKGRGFVQSACECKNG